MAATFGIEVAKGRDRAPAKRQIPRITVVQAARLGSKVERCTGEHAVMKVTGKGPVTGKQGFVVLGIVGPELGRPRSKACRSVACQPDDVLVINEPG